MTKYIIKNNKTNLDNINNRINDWMKNNIPDYNAVRWGTIWKHPTKDEYVLKIKTDSRNPLSALTDNEKSAIIEPTLSDDWYVTDQNGNKVLVKA